jgi:phosphoadenosine phosphosulfate reductase
MSAAGQSHAHTGDREREALAGLAARLDTRDFIARLIQRHFRGAIALVSSFGSESAVLLHLVAQIDRRTPVLFLDSGMLFNETLAYRETLVRRLGLADLREIRPDRARIVAADPRHELWRTDPERCCALRKVEPLERALLPFRAWLNGRKRYHGALRTAVPQVERDAARFRITPLALWSRADVEAYLDAHDLPRHPLEAEGFASIGCVPCTSPIVSGEALRAGRWRHREKTECGIHAPAR